MVVGPQVPQLQAPWVHMLAATVGEMVRKRPVPVWGRGRLVPRLITVLHWSGCLCGEGAMRGDQAEDADQQRCEAVGHL